MKHLPILSILIAASIIQDNPATQVANAELAFARTSRETNTVNAFQHYLADDAVMFREGEAVDGKSLWAGRKADSTLLKWWPIVSEASSSGEIGYTTGPYQFFNKRSDKHPAGTGYYSTVWKKQRSGEWMIKIDLGVGLDSVRILPTKLEFPGRVVHTQQPKTDILTVDATYNKHLNLKGRSCDERYLAQRYRIHRPLIGALVNTTYPLAKTDANKKFSFEMLAGEAASSNDLAYTYGNVSVTGTATLHKSNYLRVWINENGQWKIVLDVITEG